MSLKERLCMKFCKEQLLLYAVTDRSREGGEPLLSRVEKALEGGATMIQLREKDMDRKALEKEASEIKELCMRYNVPFIINDDVDAALSVGADGVHVGEGDEPCAKIRERAGRDFIIGVTAKTVARAREAEAAGADYLGVGAVFPSSTKSIAKRITAKEFSDISESVGIPCVAIGGITLENMESLRSCGAAGVAVVSAIFSEENIVSATKKLKAKAMEIFV